MGDDEEGMLAALKAIQRELGDPKIKEHRGRILGSSPRTKTTGDGLPKRPDRASGGSSNFNRK
jgi:adenylate cyclase